MTAIEFDNISKQYRLGVVSTGTLSHDLHRWWQTSVLRHEDPYLKIGDTNDRSTKALSEYVWALKDISFKVEEGDVVGIIGKNGAGKSTLLKLLSKVTAPTTGTIRAKGRIASLLEVGTGFHGEMTGRENIYLNCAILGMTKQEIARKLDEIVDFSGCERYIDTPVKRYSSGMTVRLGFAVAAFLDPEILVVDEVLAVGDAEFQKKAIGKMQDISHGEGRTVLFVSHNMESVQRLCHKGLLLENGEIAYTGTATDTIATYQKLYAINDIKEWIGPLSIKRDGITFNRFVLYKDGSVLNAELKSDDNLIVEIDFTIEDKIPDLTIGISVFDERGRYVYRTLQVDTDDCFNDKMHIGNNVVRAELPISFLKSGLYNVVLDVSRHNSRWIIDPFNQSELVLSFNVNQSEFFSQMHSTSAIISPRIEWKLQ